jgi:hypothetical protein
MRSLDSAGSWSRSEQPVMTRLVRRFGRSLAGVGIFTRKGERLGSARAILQPGRDCLEAKKARSKLPARPSSEPCTANNRLRSKPFLRSDPKPRAEPLQAGNNVKPRDLAASRKRLSVATSSVCPATRAEATCKASRVRRGNDGVRR